MYLEDYCLCFEKVGDFVLANVWEPCSILYLVLFFCVYYSFRFFVCNGNKYRCTLLYYRTNKYTMPSVYILDLCKDVHCKFGAKCENGNCVCPMDCPETYDPLCGSNGVTYANECNLKSTECQMGTDVIVASYGECEDLSSSGNGKLLILPFQ